MPQVKQSRPFLFPHLFLLEHLLVARFLHVGRVLRPETLLEPHMAQVHVEGDGYHETRVEIEFGAHDFHGRLGLFRPHSSHEPQVASEEEARTAWTFPLQRNKTEAVNFKWEAGSRRGGGDDGWL